MATAKHDEQIFLLFIHKEIAFKMAKFGKFDMRVLQLNHSHYASRFAVTHNNVFVNSSR